MKKEKFYINGQLSKIGQFREAEQTLIKSGKHRKHRLGNFGPYYPEKLTRIVKPVETFIYEGYEFIIVESEGMSFSLDTLQLSKPHTQKECWFQPV
jgi:hypothetical protein